MDAQEVKTRINELNSTYEQLKLKKMEVIKEYASYFHSIRLDYASDLFRHFIKENPDHKYLEYCKVRKPAQTGHLSDVTISIPKFEITKCDFIEFARLIDSTHRGEYSIERFKSINEDE